MSDFVSEFWAVYIALLTLVSIIACGLFLWSQSKARVAIKTGTDTTGHVWDETLTEYNNPLPRWWMWLFYITIVFSLGYLVLFPGLGSYTGTSRWSSGGQYDAEMKQADARYGPVFAKYADLPVEQVAADAQARAIGERLFLNHCAQCHGSDGRGARGFPNLADSDWQYGGTPDAIRVSILEGRNAAMPGLAAVLGTDADVRNVAEYVLSLSASPHDAVRAAQGKEKFAVCAACHGDEGKGNPLLGAPSLADRVWLYGGSVESIVETITKGRNGVMPAHRDTLGETKVHLLTAYVWSLSNGARRDQKAQALAASDSPAAN